MPIIAKPPPIPAALSHFDQLPDDARVRVAVVAALNGYSIPTAWRRARAGELPQPIRDGRVTSWRVGDLRAAMAAKAGA